MGDIYLCMFIPFFQKIDFINIYIYTSDISMNITYLCIFIPYFQKTYLIN
jgi:hypothetical protein